MLAVRKCLMCGEYFDAEVGEPAVYCDLCQQARDFAEDYREEAGLAEELCDPVDDSLDEEQIRTESQEKGKPKKGIKQDLNEFEGEVSLSELFPGIDNVIPDEIEVIAVGKPMRKHSGPKKIRW